MNTDPADKIAEIARLVLRNEWVPNSAVDVGTKKAIRITRLWQQHICAEWPGRYQKEFRIAAFNEKIDLVDLTELIAYELKVSANNPHFEFYRDIFKVWVHNSRSTQKIKRLCFLTPERGAIRLARGLGAAVRQRCDELGFAIQVIPLNGI